MRILWVKVGGLWPPNTGGRLRSLHILAELARRHAVSVLTTHAPDEDPTPLRERLGACERVSSIPYAIPKWHSARFPVAVLKSWASALPVDVWKCAVPGLREEVEHRLVAGRFDVCVADFLFATPNVPFGGPVPVVFFAHNVEHMIWKRLSDTERRPWRRALLEIEWRKMRRYEADTCRRARLTVAVSPEDRAALAAGAPEAKVREVETGVDAQYFAPRGMPEAPARLVYVGSMDWHPNEDAVLHFIDAVLPKVRAAVPAAALTVVGRNPSARLKRAAAAAGVTVTGTVDDVRPYLDSAAVCVVPLRIGGGTRLKIFEALAMAKAVVSTSIGAEGLPLVDGEHALLADTPAAFADAVVTLLRDPARRRALGAAGRRLVEDRYSWSRVAEEFAGLCAEAAA